MRQLLPLLAVLCLAFAPAPFPRPDRPADLRKLEGEWVLVSLTSGGVTDHPRKWLFISGHSLSITAAGSAYVSRYRFTLNPKASPPNIDLRMFHGNTVTHRMNSSYLLRGDELLICYHLAARDRQPAEVSGRKPGTCLMVFKRQ